MASERIRRLKAAASETGQLTEDVQTEDWYLPAAQTGWARFTVLSPGAGIPLENTSELTAFEVGIRFAQSVQSATFAHDISGEDDISPGSSSPMYGWITWTDDRLIVCWDWPESEAQAWARFSVDDASLPDPEADEWTASDLREIAYLITQAVQENLTAETQGSFD